MAINRQNSTAGQQNLQSSTLSNPWLAGESLTNANDFTFRSWRRHPSDFDFIPNGLLGQGGYGRVLLVKDRQDDKIYAMKIIHKRNKLHDTFNEALVQEVKIHKRLKHPYITRMHYFCEDASNVYFIMTYAENGKSLRAN